MEKNSLSYIQKGAGKDLVLLHGYLSDKESFAAQIEHFSKFFRVTALDLPGFGGAEPIDGAWDVSDYAKWTKDALCALNIVKPHVIAHSFGCRVAVKLAAMCADENSSFGVKDEKRTGQVFDQMLLTGPAGIISGRGIRYKIRVKSYRICKKFFPRYAEKHFGSREFRTLSPLMRESYKKIVNEDLRGDAAKIKNKVLIVEGAADKTTPLAEAKIYLSAFENGRLIITDGGHFAFAEYPVTFNLIAEEFFLL